MWWPRRSRTPGWRCGAHLAGTAAARSVPGLWGIAIRRLIGVQRRRNRWAPPTIRSDDQVVVSAEDRVLLGVEHGDLAGALASLSPELRSVVQATVLDGLTTKEAAHAVGHPARDGEEPHVSGPS